ncbi:pentatricopeptide repeat-containing protein At5g66520-like [Diospyros lotus]|uniref:pentatricopeptide repeat-containing protein At5g66520-like n=1 Tax=Diospyros lotus TaxID=55363 RepID=UPI00224E1B8C|nr:pentatricopeptide repeat-containing protein At5g66520-like [Diospyros lotus]
MAVGFASKYLKSSQRALSLLDQPWLSMSQIKEIQAHLIVSATISDPFAAGKLVAICAISARGDLSHAYSLFRLVPHRSTFMWNTMLRAFVEKNEAANAVSLYKQMVRSGLLPNNYTFSFLLRACVDLSECSLGLGYHGQAVKLGWESYDFVQNGLIHLYATCGCVDFARKLFDASLNRDIVTWTALINGYVKSGQVGIARELFDEMPEKNAVSWSAMITGYAQVGLFREALELFNTMQLAGIRPNHAGVVSTLSACAFLGALDQGRWIHAYIDKHKMELDRVLGTALVDMYAKCGCLVAAGHVFDAMPNRDVYAFTSLISGLANHGQSARVFELLIRMQNEGFEPNDVTFICILSACSRMGLVEEGLRIFESMRKVYGIDPGVEHYGCLVDLLGRAGMLEQAKNVVREMPMEPDSYVLGALLNACRVRGDLELGREVVDGLVKRNLDHGGVHVLLSNIYASANKWGDVENVRKKMEAKKVRKVPGCSLIEVDGVVCEFVAGDRSHARMGEIILLSMVSDRHLKYIWSEDDDIPTELVNL